MAGIQTHDSRVAPTQRNPLKDALPTELPRISVAFKLVDREPVVESVAKSSDDDVPEKSKPEKKIESGNKEPDLDLKPNEVVVKKEIIRTEYAPYLNPGDLHYS